MIKWENILKYREQFGTDNCAYIEPDSFSRIFVEDSNGIPYIQPKEETDEVFLDRIERSKQAGENLFFKEWEKSTEGNNPNVFY